MAVGRMVVELHHAALGGTGTNTFALRVDGAFHANTPAWEEVADSVHQFFSDLVQVYDSSTTIDFDGEIHGLGPDEGETTSVDSWTETGITGGGVLAPALAMCITWKTQSGGRSGIGRTFVGPLAFNVGEPNGTPTEAALGNVNLRATELVERNIALGNGAVAIWSTKDSVARDITSGRCKNQFAVLRSRRD